MDTSTAPPGFTTNPQGQTGLALVSQQQAAGGGNHGGNVGPVIGVLAVIAVLGILAGLAGRLFSGRTVMGYGPHFDVEAWVESKCVSCLDGHVAAPRFQPPPPPPHMHMAMESFPTATAAGGWRPENVSVRPRSHPPRHPHPRPEPPHLQAHSELHLRPLPTRQAPVVEPEITAAQDQEDRRRPPEDVVEDEEEEVSDLSDHE